MKAYLSSYRIPVADDLAKLVGKPLSEISVALIPNAKDYYSRRAWDCKVGDMTGYMERRGLSVKIVDLRTYNNPERLKKALAAYNLVWVMGGNTYVLRYEMRRSGFETIIKELLDQGLVYGGDSAGALIAGASIAGVEQADEPEFAQAVIKDGLNIVPYVVLPHVDNPAFAGILPTVKELHQGKKEIIELKDSQAVLFDGTKHWITQAAAALPAQAPEKASQVQLADCLVHAARQVTVGGRYMHYKQHRYTVLALGLREEDNEPCVVYQAEYGAHLTFIRSLSNWLEEVEVEGKKVKRFEKITP